MQDLFQDVYLETEERASKCIDALTTLYEDECMAIDSFYAESVSDETFTESEAKEFKLAEKMKKAKAYIMQAIETLMQKIKEFAKTVAERVSNLVASAVFKDQVKKAHAQMRNYQGMYISICDLPKMHKNGKEVTKTIKSLISGILKKYGDRYLTDSDLDRCRKNIDESLDKYKESVNQMKKIDVPVADALRISEEYVSHIKTGHMQELLDMLESVKIVVKGIKPDKQSEANASDVVRLINHAVSELKSYKSEFATQTLIVTRAVVRYTKSGKFKGVDRGTDKYKHELG